MPHAALQSSLVADTWLAWHSMPADESVHELVGYSEPRTEIHDVVPADGAVIYDDVWERTRYSQHQRSRDIGLYTPHAHNATAFHYKKERHESALEYPGRS